jgi:hypothetical protein
MSFLHHAIRQRIAPRTHQRILLACANNPHAVTVLEANYVLF